jgi:cysteinyl-tRNA synthetase
MKKQELQEAILADVLDELGKVHQSVHDLPFTLQQATTALTSATQNSQKYTDSLKEAADSVVAASVETTKAQLVEAVSRTAEMVAHNTSRKNMLQWAAGCVLVAVVSFSLFGYLMHSMAWEAGYQGGRNDAMAAKDYKADACDWYDTQEGQMAIGLYKAGSLRNLYTCDKPGWVIEKQQSGLMCIPKAEGKAKQPQGWQLPSE